MPPTSQNYQQLAPQASPQSQASMAVFQNPYSMSFDASQQSLAQPQPSFSQSFPNGPVSNPGFARSFDTGAMRGFGDKPQIYTAVYSGVSVYEMDVGGVACMRRRSDGWLNATQILKVAGVEKGKRTKVLEKEILTGEHEKVQGGYGKYQGTWISYRRGREFCRQYGVEDALRPLLDYDVSADGTSGQGQDTPTKEQALAAQRKKLYHSNLDGRPNGSALSNGTFFSNISPTTSVALAAMSKAARLNSPAPRPPSAQRPAIPRQSSQSDALPGGSQQSVMDMDTRPDSGFGTQHTGEPPRKRMRADSQDGFPTAPSLLVDASMRSATPTEPNESFLYENIANQDAVYASAEPIALAPLPSPVTEEQQEKMNLILDLFAEQGRSEYASHAALTQLSGEDLNMPLDASANNALHWAATLAKVPLLKLLVRKGANIWRGNAAGQSPLVSAVLVNNCWEQSCFPELLELLGPLIETRDLQGRTILHHIAVSSGIKGRAPSSKYYLEALLEFLVRIGTQPTVTGSQNAQGSQDSSAADHLNSETFPESSHQLRGPVSLVRFLSHIVNARDKAGNTALNLVARIGNRSIIQQLLEIHADPGLPNNKGVSAKDFGVGVETIEQPPLGGMEIARQALRTLPTLTSTDTEGNVINGSQTEELEQEMIASMTSMLAQNLASHKELLRTKTERIDHLNEQIRELSASQKADLDKLQALKERVKLRAERQAKIANLKREIEKKRAALHSRQNDEFNTSGRDEVDLNPDWLNPDNLKGLNGDAADGEPSTSQRGLATSLLPSVQTLQARLNAYHTDNARLQHDADELRSRSTELEDMYRKVVSMCTGVAEDRIEESLPALVAAVESERGGLGEKEVRRVREFLRRVDGSSPPAAPVQQPALTVNPTISAAAAAAAAAAVQLVEGH